jgi:hypothetical protein
VDSGEISEFLNLREKSYTLPLITFFALSLLLMTIARIRNTKSIQTVVATFLKNTTLEQVLKENMRLESISSVVLLLNYFVSFSLCLFIFFHRMLQLDIGWSVTVAGLLPIGLFMVETIGLIFTGIVSGEFKKLSNTIVVTITGNQFAGILLSLISLFWIMNPEYNSILVLVFVTVIGLKYLLRLIKISFTVLINSVPLYYLILYFCTLEILPLFVAYVYALKNFLI